MDMEQKKNEDEQLFSRLVQEELSLADRLSPGEALTDRLKARIAAESASGRGVHARLLRLVPVSTAILGLIMGIALLRHALFSPGRALALSACMARQMLDTSGDSPELGPDNPYAQAWRRLQRQDGNDSSYERLFRAHVSGTQASGAVPVLWPERGHRKLSFDETVRILFFERSLEKSLTENAKNNGEV
jgi:hypothetical protein